jgi:hypothetical protein
MKSQNLVKNNLKLLLLMVLLQHFHKFHFPEFQFPQKEISCEINMATIRCAIFFY